VPESFGASGTTRPRVRGAVLVIAVLAAMLGSLMACGTADQEPRAGASGDQTGFVAGDGSVTIIPAADRVLAPAISGRTLDGRPWSLAEHRGRVVVVNVWASWCAPCRAEAAELRTAAEERAGSGVDFVGLNTRDSAAAARAFLTRFAIEYPTVVDSDGGLQAQFAGTLPPQAIPSTLVIDEQGRVAARILGKVTEASLEAVISEVQGSAGR